MSTKLTDASGSRVFGLQIKGCKTRFYYRASPFSTTGYVDKNSILSISGYSASIEPSGGIAKYTPITISLAADLRKPDENDPGVIFSRTSRSKSVWQGQVLSDISRDDATPTIIVDREPSIDGVQISTPHTFFIGGESFAATSITDNLDGTWSLTTNGRDGLRQLHQIRLGGTDTPIISSEITNWRGRLCEIYAGSVDVHGRVFDKQLIYSGFIEASPYFSDPTTVSLSVVPLSAMLDNKITTNNNISRLVRDGHYFAGPTYFETTSTLTNVDTGVQESPFSTDGSVLTDSAGFMTNEDIRQAINRAGSASLPQFSLNQQGGYFMSVRHTGFDGGVGYRIESLLFYELFSLRDKYFRETGRPYGADVGSLLYLDGGGVQSLYTSDEKTLFTAFDFTANTTVVYEQDISEEPYFGEDVRKLYALANPVADDRINIYEVKGLARSFRMKGEPYLLLEASLDLPNTDTGVSFPIQIKVNGKTYYPRVTHETIETFGVLVYLDMNDGETRALPPIYDWFGAERAEITRGFSIPSTNAGSAILQLLESGGGSNINGSYDLQLTGCNLPEASIDVNSFLGLSYSTNINQWQMNFDIGELSIRDVLEPMLKAMGCGIVMKGGKIALVAIANEFNTGNLTNITDSDMLVDPPPLSTLYEDIITQYIFKYDFRREKPSEAIFNNYDAINRLNGETAKLELNLYGITSEIIGGQNQAEIYPFLRPTLARLFTLFSEPVRKWNFSVGSGKALNLDLGALVSISSDYLRGYEDTVGVSWAVAMITSIDVKLMEEVAEIETLFYNQNATVYNAGAKVSAIPSTTSLDFSEFTYSLEGDLSFFKVGDVVNLYNLLSDSTVSKTIQSIIGNRVFFTTTHTILSTNTIMVPVSFGSTTDAHRARAYIADVSGLGGGSVEAYDYQ